MTRIDFSHYAEVKLRYACRIAATVAERDSRLVVFAPDTQVQSWPEGLCAHVDAWMSRDNGATWGHVMGGDLHGGNIHDKFGNLATTRYMMFTWPGEAGPSGRVALKGSDVKMTATVYQAMTTQITLESITITAG